MAFWCFAVFTFVVITFLVLGIIIPICRSHKKITNGVINYDSTMRKFVYKVNLPREDIINLLNAKKETDELSCTFDFERSVVNFADYDSSRDYFIQIQECNGYRMLRLEQVARIGMQSLVPFKLNPFIVSKLKAEIVPFSQYGLEPPLL